MFKLIAIFSALCAVASAGLISPYSHGYGLSYASPAIHAPLISHAPIVKTYAAPVISAPIVKTIAHPVATSYANTYKIATKSYPVVHAAPAYVHAAPAVLSTSTLHGVGHLGSLGYGGYGLGLGHGYGHGLYH